MKQELLERIVKQLNIPESNLIERTRQAVYSAAGSMALASLWDRLEEETISVRHFTDRIKKIFAAYEDIYPEIGHFSDELANEIYDIYRRTGYFYHNPHHIAPAVCAIARVDDILLCRNTSPGDHSIWIGELKEDYGLSMSGLGTYGKYGAKVETHDVMEMFDLPKQTLSQYLNELLSTGSWTSIRWPEDTEFLSMEQFNSYWRLKPHTDGRISLARYGGMPPTQYVFYYYDNGKPLIKQIPVWRLRDVRSKKENDLGGYFRVAAALLHRNQLLQPSKVKIVGDVAEIQLGYRLPPEEEAFFKLYSWPVEYTENSNPFHRKMTVKMYLVFCTVMKKLGYQFVEELEE